MHRKRVAAVSTNNRSLRRSKFCESIYKGSANSSKIQANAASNSHKILVPYIEYPSNQWKIKLPNPHKQNMLPLIKMACAYEFEKLKSCIQKTNTQPITVINSPHGRVIQANFKSFAALSPDKPPSLSKELLWLIHLQASNVMIYRSFRYKIWLYYPHSGPIF